MDRSLLKPTVSVVTPVFNTEKYLPQCIESVLNQTYNDLEYIIVDNCSTDRSLEIAQEYAEKDNRIRITKNVEHFGMLQNWNHAVRQISPESKYCKIVHADDWLFPECIERMVDVAESHPDVGIVGSYRLDELWVNCDGLPYPSTVVSGRQICRDRLLGGPFLFGSPSTIFLRSDIIQSRESFYNESNFHADTEVCYEILQDYNFGFVHQVLSFTRRHNESATSFAKRFNSYVLSELLVLIKYGPIYLEGEEYDRLLKKRLKMYYRFLGRSVYRCREKEFWDYHRKGLGLLGYSFSKLKIFKWCLFIALSKMIDIRSHINYLLRFFKHRFSQQV
jgi:glycosyltransferase involved in cell wall biosynthesis